MPSSFAWRGNGSTGRGECGIRSRRRRREGRYFELFGVEKFIHDVVEPLRAEILAITLELEEMYEEQIELTSKFVFG